MHVSRRILLTCALLVGVATSMTLRPTPSYAVGDIHIIIVRSTTDASLSEASTIWQQRLEDALNGRNYSSLLDYDGAVQEAGVPGGLGASDVATYRTLTSSEETAPENIMKVCLEVSQKAGPDDAIVCIVSCRHSFLKTTDDRIIHALAPLATSINDLDLRRDGIQRETILICLTHELVNDKIQEKKHRLVVLITDPCVNPARRVKELLPIMTASLDRTTNIPHAKVFEKVVPKYKPYFKAFLEKATGVVNINACNYGQEAYYEVGFESDDVLGSLFINAFCRFANNGFYLDMELNPDAFYKLLQLELARQIAAFHSPETVRQDLTRFNGVEIVKDDKVKLVSDEDFNRYYAERAKMMKYSGEFRIEKSSGDNEDESVGSPVFLP
ncbi:MAG: hypothetical protein IJL92_02500 [Thermoguttaceae bacterium]|nr:hypothetical protein [Thermoguttaceae bacterium]